MTVETGRRIFDICNTILDHDFTIFGIKTDLWHVTLFGILLAVILSSILRVFSND